MKYTTPTELMKAIHRRQITRHEAAGIIGVDDRTVYRWLSGERRVPVWAVTMLEA
jgi:hypothetical protein